MNTGYSYSKYWKTWSRVLKFDGSWSIEVNLTPINSSWQYADWDEEVKPIIIRRHLPPQHFKVVEELPTEIKEMMVEKLGEELVQRLLTEDFLSQIDYWDKYDVDYMRMIGPRDSGW